VGDPFDEVDDAPVPAERPQLAVVEPTGHHDGFLSQLGVAWTIVLSILAVGAVLVAAFVWQPMMSLR
jgi:hypothetical protein